MIMLVKYLSEKTALSVYRPLWRHLRYRSVHTTNCLLSEEEAKRKNEINIQMLTESLHNQIFTEGKSPRNGNSRHGGDLSAIERSLKKHGLWGKESTVIPDVDFELPRLLGNNIDEHFRELALQQLVGYYELTEQLMDCSPPSKPKEWARTVGWTKYDPVTGEATPVPYPDEEILVFDIEILIEEGHYPTMATAVSPTNWYSWCAGCVLKDKYRWVSYPYLSDLIPMETLPGQHTSDSGQWKKRIVIGHNVGFDRSFIKEQYYVKKTKTKFLDTMSLHIAICGLTNFQRVLYQASRKNSNRKEVREYMEGKQARHQFTETEWQEKSSLNNLNDVYQLHCNGEPLQKGTRDVFVSGSMSDVRENYQTLMTYCAGDVEATLKVFQKLWPEFLLRFPHPVTLAGMFEMVSAYLPVNKSWQQYIGQSNAVYDDLQIELQKSLQKLADDSCQLLHNEQYKDDPWLWDLDWSVSEFKMNKPKKKEIRKKDETSEEALKRILDTKERIPKRPVHMAGYPGWYKALCPKKKQENWAPGPSLISTQMRVTPKLMRLTWNGYPLHYHDEYGWGYIVPDKFKAAQDRENMVLLGEDEQKNVSQYPIRSVFQFCGDKDTAEWIKPMSDEEFENLVNNSSKIAEDSMEWDEKRRHFEINGFEPKSKTKPKKSSDDDDRIDIGIPGCWFYRLPHKDGKKKNVGNPLAKDFLQHIEAGTLKACSGTQADRALTLSKKCSYWKNNQDRIGYQMAVALDLEELPDTVTNNSEFEEDSFYGAIVPRIVPAGTITRRAVEKTWLTASNAYVDRVGSELKAMIQSPPGYHFVGADVDSQELWIAAIIGDSYSKIHGSTPFGWMTLQGKKSDKTDLHSKTAETVSISRDHAKVFNYGRIYGAGQKFAETLLMQFNHKLTPLEAQEKARLMYTTTKGRRSGKNRKWIDGTESEMFNRLEEIATCKQPKTPVLSCSISKSLEPENIGDDFMTSRINWVVQSSAVDYLHLMLVCMKWLFEEYDIDGRFAISIHDEVRYLVASKDRYRAALALQITNLLTRSMFAYKLGMKDLPQSVAFFSAVDIDHCLRKEVNMECKTPSNPHGMERGYNISNGEALDIHEVLEKTNQSLEAKGEEPEKTEVVMAS